MKNKTKWSKTTDMWEVLVHRKDMPLWESPPFTVIVRADSQHKARRIAYALYEPNGERGFQVSVERLKVLERLDGGEKS